jgi:hypothetical protein
MVSHAKRAGRLVASYRAAEALVRRRDTVMHRHMFDTKIVERQALDSIADLLLRVAELLEKR